MEYNSKLSASSESPVTCPLEGLKQLYQNKLSSIHTTQFLCHFPQCGNSGTSLVPTDQAARSAAHEAAPRRREAPRGRPVIPDWLRWLQTTGCRHDIRPPWTKAMATHNIATIIKTPLVCWFYLPLPRKKGKCLCWETEKHLLSIHMSFGILVLAH